MLTLNVSSHSSSLMSARSLKVAWCAALLTRMSRPPSSRIAARVLDVAADEGRLAAGLLDPFAGLVRVVVLVQVGDQDVGALAREGNGDGTADAAVAAGDHRLLAGEPSASLVALLAVVGSGLHGGGMTGHALLLLGQGWLCRAGHRDPRKSTDC